MLKSGIFQDAPSFTEIHIIDEPAASAKAISDCTPLIKHSSEVYNDSGNIAEEPLPIALESALHVLMASPAENNIAPPKSNDVDNNGLIM